MKKNPTRNEVYKMESNTTENKAKPETQFRAGAISASVWNNEGTKKTGETFTFKSITLSRGYKDPEGNWKNTTSFRTTDIPRVSLVLSKAYEHVSLTQGPGITEEVVA